ncbi:hypothetical protein [Rhodohalobacter sp. 8-1]|uniref:hypothetical protein n=1 Tax=Rhodohalobacter sp. 8-1 TaxID=3131972 RepID=UPI0030ECEEC3
MRSIKIDIINDKAMNLLRDLEKLKLIRLREDKKERNVTSRDWSKYKGAMTKQPLNEIDQQLKELRNEWE